MTTLQEVKQLAESRGARRVDLKVTDLLGRWQHFGMPLERFTHELASEGLGFDGSSLRGFQPIEDSDMMLVPDLETAVFDPVPQHPTLSLICDVVDPISRERYSRDPRYVAQKAEAHLRTTALADTAYFGPELEFFIFDDVRFQQTPNTSFYFVDSSEADWNSGRDEAPNLGYKVPTKSGYSPTPPFDSHSELRWAVVEALESVGLTVEVTHHEVATGGQGEIATAYRTLLQKADEVQWYKYLVRNVARAFGQVATFMPKPVYGDNGSGMHTHQSLWRDDSPVFFDSNGYAGLSQTARYYIGGLLRHAPAVLAFASPSTNSYKRLVPGFEAPVNLVYYVRNRSAAVRIPTYSQAGAAKRIEFRPPDGTANPYLAFAAMLMAGLDGIQSRIDPGDPVDKNVYELAPEEAKRLATVPATLENALDALEKDCEFLKKGDVFTQDLIERWIEFKRAEVLGLNARPTAYEYELYFNG